jgi:tetratricopeptide (TPR) repeat protein
MAGSALKRLWDAMKPGPPVRREYEPPFMERLRNALRPPQAPGHQLTPEEQRRRQRTRRFAIAGFLILAAAGGGYYYVVTAPQRARDDLRDGMQQMAAGNYQVAVGRFTSASRIWPGQAVAYYQRGVAHQNLNQTAAAFQDFQLAVRTDPKLAAAHVALGALYFDRGDFQRAVEEATRAIDLSPTVDSYNQRGQAYEALGEHKKAIADYNAALAQFPDSPYIYRARALAEENLGDRSAAEHDRDYARTLELSNPVP